MNICGFNKGVQFLHSHSTHFEYEMQMRPVLELNIFLLSPLAYLKPASASSNKALHINIYQS